MRAAAALVVTAAAALLLASGASAFGGADAIAAMDSARALYGEPALDVVPYDSLRTDDYELYASPDAPDAAVSLSRWPLLAATLIDPRTTEVGVVPGSHNGVLARFSGPGGSPPATLIQPASYDPASPLGLSFMLPAPLVGTVTLTEKRGPTEVSLPVVAYTAPVPGGAQLVQVDVNDDDGLRLAYNTLYNLDLGGTTITFRTTKLPAAFLARSWTFDKSVTPAAKGAWIRATGNLSPLARHVLDEIDGAVTVLRRACGGGEGGGSCATWVDAPLAYTVSLSPYDFTYPDGTRFVALHELGHEVEFLGLDSAGYKAFRTLFERSPSWRACFRDPFDRGHCVPMLEIFADQFAFWATGFPSDPQGGYGDPPLASAADFGRLLAQQFAFRPPYWRNPAR